MPLITYTIAAITEPSAEAQEAARARQDAMTKPRGALGALEDVSVRLAGLAGTCPPPIPAPVAVTVFAGDHGVHAQGVTPWPQEVTAQMVENFLAGGAVVNAFAAQLGADVTVVDVGVAADLSRAPGLLARNVAHGTADMTAGPAMTLAQARQAVETGIEIAGRLVADGYRCLVTGDMGIANTTASAALISAFTGRDPAGVTGRGTGVDDATHARKIDVVRRALARNGLTGEEVGAHAPVRNDLPGADEGVRAPARDDLPGEDVAARAPGRDGLPGEDVGAPAPARGGPPGKTDALRVLAAVGGFEHAALAGYVLGAAAHRVPVVLDGVIAGSAALAAAAFAPAATSACVAGHRSAEPGHAAVLEHLRLRPLVDLELRLGEGTGALLAVPIVQSAVRALREVATFDSAGVTDKTE